MPAKKRKPKNKPVLQDDPASYAPKTARDLIGPARKIATDLLMSLDPRTRRGNLKLLLYGNAGDGKSSIARMLAAALAEHPIDVEKINGRSVSIELVREWQRNACYASLFGGWKIRFIEETDLIPLAAQDLMLTLLDDLPPRNAILGTSNLNLETLSTRFQTRFRLVKVDPPGDDTLAAWLVSRWGLPHKTAAFIALGACGNVRQALLDAADFLTFGKAVHRPKPPVIVKDAAASARALKAWDTMRGKAVAA